MTNITFRSGTTTTTRGVKIKYIKCNFICFVFRGYWHEVKLGVVIVDGSTRWTGFSPVLHACGTCFFTLKGIT
jgi:hypothetical protein